MSLSEIKLLKSYVAKLEAEIEGLREENNRLKQINRRLSGAQSRPGRPRKFVNFLDLYGTVPDVLNPKISAQALVKSKRKQLAEHLGDLSEKAMQNSIYEHRKKISKSSEPPMSSEELEESLKDLF